MSVFLLHSRGNVTRLPPRITIEQLYIVLELYIPYLNHATITTLEKKYNTTVWQTPFVVLHQNETESFETMWQPVPKGPAGGSYVVSVLSHNGIDGYVRYQVARIRNPGHGSKSATGLRVRKSVLNRPRSENKRM